MGMFDGWDRMMREMPEPEPWEPPPQPKPSGSDWRPFIVGLAAFGLLLGCALYLAFH